MKSSGSVRFKDMVERFKVYDQPRRPEGKEEEWLAGERADTRGKPSAWGWFEVLTGEIQTICSMAGCICLLVD